MQAWQPSRAAHRPPTPAVLLPPYSAGSTEASIHSRSASCAPALSCSTQCNTNKAFRQPFHATSLQHGTSGYLAAAYVPGPPGPPRLGRVQSHEFAGVRVDEGGDEAPDDAPPAQKGSRHSCAVGMPPRAAAGLQQACHKAPQSLPACVGPRPPTTRDLPAWRVDQEGLVQAARVMQVEQRARLAAAGVRAGGQPGLQAAPCAASTAAFRGLITLQPHPNSSAQSLLAKCRRAPSSSSSAQA